MRVLVCGDRGWTDRRKISQRLRLLPRGAVIVHGAARGADALAGNVADGLGMAVEAFPADWARYGRSAGPIRNRQMLDTKPDLVIAFHADLSRSKGTADCVREARRRGLPVEVIG